MPATAGSICARRTNEHRDLFFGFPNSYGTLGYALAGAGQDASGEEVRAHRAYPLSAIRPPTSAALQRALRIPAPILSTAWCLAPMRCYLTTGTIRRTKRRSSATTLSSTSTTAPSATRTTDYLTARDFLWRWDTDWFWCSKNLGAQNPLVRRLLGKARLNSRTYTKVMRWNSRWKLTQRLDALFGVHRESVIQDVDIPIERAAEFLDFFQREIGILPIWICPIRSPDARVHFSPVSAESIARPMSTSASGMS